MKKFLTLLIMFLSFPIFSLTSRVDPEESSELYESLKRLVYYRDGEVEKIYLCTTQKDAEKLLGTYKEDWVFIYKEFLDYPYEQDVYIVAITKDTEKDRKIVIIEIVSGYTDTRYAYPLD